MFLIFGQTTETVLQQLNLLILINETYGNKPCLLFTNCMMRSGFFMLYGIFGYIGKQTCCLEWKLKVM